MCWICAEDRHEDCAGVTFDDAGNPNGSCTCWEAGHYPQPKSDA